MIHSIEVYDDNSVIFGVEDEKSEIQILDFKNNTSKNVYLPKTTFSPLDKSSFLIFFKDSKERYWVPSRKINGKGYKVSTLDKNLALIHEIESPLYKNKALVTYIFETENGQIWGIGATNQDNDRHEYPHVYLSLIHI